MQENKIKKIAYDEAVRWYINQGYTQKQAEKMANFLIYDL